MSDTYLPPWHRDYLLLGMGAEAEFDYASEGTSFDERLGHCYQLAAKAFVDVEDLPEGQPKPNTLVHGSWHGPGAKARIDHAWVLLDDGRVWEPITAVIFNRERFYSYTNAIEKQTYPRLTVLSNLLEHEHFGPWVPPYI